MRKRHGQWLWSRSLRRLLSAAILTGLAQLAFADSEFADAWGPAIGTAAPLLAASDQDGKLQRLDTLAGPNGLLIVFNRSVDW
ncbi:MAG: hypothetical protein AAGG11_17865 [Pseudomonadota bacterium]